MGNMISLIQIRLTATHKIVYSNLRLTRSSVLIHSFKNSSFATLNAKRNKSIDVAMRHGLRTNRLGKPADQRKALIRGLVTEVLTHGKIKTTLVRAKYVRKYVDKIISLAKDGSLNARRQIEGFVYNKKLVVAILGEAPKRYEDRNGGYSRVTPLVNFRRGDAAKMATIELL